MAGLVCLLVWVPHSLAFSSILRSASPKENTVHGICNASGELSLPIDSPMRITCAGSALAAGVAAVVVAAAPVVVAAAIAAEQPEQNDQYDNPAAVVTFKASTVHKSSTPQIYCIWNFSLS